MSSSEHRRLAERATAAYLEWLLKQPDLPYRAIWLRRVKPSRQPVPLRDSSVLRKEAVAEVLDTHMYKQEMFDNKQYDQYEMKTDDSRPIFFRQTNRALTDGPSKRELDIFIGAFEMKREDAEELWAIWNGERHSRVIVGELDRGSPAAHETLSVDEDHHIGADGLPERQEVRQTIRALVDDLTEFPYRFDTNAVDVRLLLGGTQGDMTQFQTKPEPLWEIKFTLWKPLRLGETAHLQYTQAFQYKEKPDPEYRRCIYNRYNNWDVRIHFNQGKLPRAVWWCEWLNNTPDSPIKHEERVELDADLSVHRSVSIERAVAGFRWEW